MATETKKEVLLETSSDVIEREIRGNEITLTWKHYPMAGYGNHYGYEIVLVPRRITVAAFCDTWKAIECRNMTDYVKVAEVELNEDDYKRLRNEIMGVKSVNDLKGLVEEVKAIERRLSDRLGSIVSNIVNSVVSAAKLQKVLEKIDAKKLEEIKERLTEYTRELLGLGPE